VTWCTSATVVHTWQCAGGKEYTHSHFPLPAATAYMPAQTSGGDTACAVRRCGALSGACLGAGDSLVPAGCPADRATTIQGDRGTRRSCGGVILSWLQLLQVLPKRPDVGSMYMSGGMCLGTCGNMRGCSAQLANALRLVRAHLMNDFRISGAARLLAAKYRLENIQKSAWNPLGNMHWDSTENPHHTRHSRDGFVATSHNHGLRPNSKYAQRRRPFNHTLKRHPAPDVPETRTCRTTSKRSHTSPCESEPPGQPTTDFQLLDMASVAESRECSMTQLALSCQICLHMPAADALSRDACCATTAHGGMRYSTSKMCYPKQATKMMPDAHRPIVTLEVASLERPSHLESPRKVDPVLSASCVFSCMHHGQLCRGRQQLCV
jgi:hypothetical protein